MRSNSPRNVDSRELPDDVAMELDDIVERLAEGEAVGVESLCRKYPDSASSIRHLYPAMAAMAEFGKAPSGLESQDHSGEACHHGVLGDFRIMRELGRGGMGIVYEARQISLDRRVAIKILPFAALFDPRQLERFRNEARAAAMLKHPNIVGVHSVGYDRGVHYYSMELVEGKSLAQIISEQAGGPQAAELPKEPSVDERETARLAMVSTRIGNGRHHVNHVARIGVILAEALHHAHEQGVVHRDLKPANILIDHQGKPWITDFGLAQIQTDHRLTLTGDLLGSLRYMSPEQAAGEKLLDRTTDVYSLGITLYEFLTARNPFAGLDRQRLVERVLAGSLPRPRQLAAQIPVDLETILLKAVARDRFHRYETAGDMAEDLERFLDQKPIRARRPGRVYSIRQWAKRNRAIAALAGCLFLILLSLAITGPYIAFRQLHLAVSLQDAQVTLQHELYDAKIAAAHEALQRGGFEQTDRILETYNPTSNQEEEADDLRGWEWFYLWRQSRRAVLAPKIQDWISISGVACSPDGEVLGFANWHGQIHLHDARTRRRIWSGEQGDIVRAIEFSSKGDILATGGDDKRVILWERKIGREIVSIACPSGVRSLAFSPDGQRLAVGLRAESDSRVNLAEAPCNVEIFGVKQAAAQNSLSATRSERFRDALAKSHRWRSLVME